MTVVETPTDDNQRTINSHEDEDDAFPSSSASCLQRSLFYLSSQWKILALGQILSLLLASSNAVQDALHLRCGLSSPTFTMCIAYFVLSFHLFVLIYRQRKRHRQARGQNARTNALQVVDRKVYKFANFLEIQRPVWQYLLIAFLDVEANAITVLSFRYTTLTSVSLFDALAIPSAMLVSRLFLQRRYTWIHFLGVIVCMMGVVSNVLLDYESDQGGNSTNGAVEFPNKLKGDLFAISGGVLYGLNDVLAEATVRHNGDTAEYLGVMGICAFVISFGQVLLFERETALAFFGVRPFSPDDVIISCSETTTWWLLSAFVTMTVLGYTWASRFLMISEAAFFNLSLLTGDLWSVLFSVTEDRIIPAPLFFVALVFVLSGVVLYEMAPSPVPPEKNDFQERLAQLDNDFDLHDAADDDYEHSQEEEELSFELS